MLSLDISGIYGSKKMLPTTIIILPLKPDKVEAVEAQLSKLHPEILLFLSKIKRLYVHGYDCNPKTPNNVSTVSISSVTDHVELREKNADSRILHLSVKENMSVKEDTCKYYLWRQEFPVKVANRVDARKDVEKWVIMLAFPCGNRLRREASSVGVFSFLPTAMVTNFPFVIQADFMLASSRETIILDNKWNMGILECIPEAFVSAFESCLKEKLPSLQQAFTFLPIEVSPIQEFNKMRCSIREILQQKRIIPCSCLHGQGVFRIPSGVIRIRPEFRNILNQLGTPLNGFSSLEKYLVLGDLDNGHYYAILDFLGVSFACDNWYASCIRVCNIAQMASDEVYIKMLSFAASIKRNVLSHIALVRYIDLMGNVQLCTLSEAKRQRFKVRYAKQPELHDWLSKCNRELGCPDNTFFLPNSTMRALFADARCFFVCAWLSNEAGVKPCCALEYGDFLSSYVASNKDPKLALNLARFLYHSHRQRFIDGYQIRVCERMPIIDGSNQVRTKRAATLVSASGSKWQKLFGPSNPFADCYYVDLGEVYGESSHFGGEYIHGNELLNFLSKHSGAVDLERLQIPDAALDVASSGLSSEQAFLLLDWIRSKRIYSSHFPEKFVQSVSHGKWLKTLSGFSSPCQTVLPDCTGEVIFSVMKNFMENYNIVDQEFYMNKIQHYADELKFLGMTFGLSDLQKLVLKCTRCCASSGMSKDRALSLLIFLGYMKASNSLEDEWLKSVKEGKWLKTCQGFNAPRDSVILKGDVDAEAVLRIANIPAVDEEFYENKIASFSSELALLGVVSDTGEIYKLIAENLRSSSLTSMNSSCSLLILKCIRHLGPASSGSLDKFRNQKWLQTSSGLKCPAESVLADPEWKCLLNGIGVPVIDEASYGDEIRSYSAELKEIGVAVEFDSTINMLVAQLESCVISSRLTTENVFSLLKWIKWMNFNSSQCLSELLRRLSRVEWLKTRHGYKTPCESVLFDSTWGTISLFVDLPLVDDSFYGIRIYGYKDELRLMGVITDFERGAVFVAKGLNSPIEASVITKEGAISLLECVKIMMTTTADQSIQDDFIGNLKKSKFLMTTAGYKLPEECILFDASWDQILLQTDAPCIDQKFYGIEISLYEDQMRVIGVKVDSPDVCSLLSGFLSSLSETEMIKRIYNFLNKFSWKPVCGDGSQLRVWIPNYDVVGGKWVNSQLCILHDKSNLFGSHLYRLDAYYDKELFPFFSSSFGVAACPSLGDYLRLWHEWIGRANQQVTLAECCGFWGYIVENWKCDEDILRHALTHVPAVASSGEEIVLARKEEVFIPDDLAMTKLFSSIHTIPLFVWLPKCSGYSFVSPRRLLHVYNALGVRKISESIECERSSTCLAQNCLLEIPRTALIGKGLIKIILCFLSGPETHMSEEKRRKVVKSLLNLSSYVCENPMHFSYKLEKSENMILEVKKKQLVHWDKAEQHLLVDKSGYEGSKDNIEFVSCFAEEIAEGILSKERTGSVDCLYNIIKTGFLLDFKDDVVDFLLTKANLELSKEDGDFLDEEFSNISLPTSKLCQRKREKSAQVLIGPLTPVAACKKQRK